MWRCACVLEKKLQDLGQDLNARLHASKAMRCFLLGRGETNAGSFSVCYSRPLRLFSAVNKSTHL